MIAYFDTSALIKLVVEERGSSVARELWNSCDAAVTGRLTYPEARAALAAAQRSGRITSGAHREAKASIVRRLGSMRIVELSETVARAAGDLAEILRLRGSDAIHIAAAALPGDPDVVFVTWDRGQRRGAVEAGLAVAGLEFP